MLGCWLSLILWISYVLSGFSWKDEWIMTNHVNEWYQPWEQCVFKDTNELNPIDLLQRCQEKYGKDSMNFTDYKCRIGGERFQYSCALDGPPPTPGYHLRPYLLKSLRGFDHPSKFYLRDFMLTLLKLNGNLLVFGDSQVQSLCRAMTCELARTKNSPDPPQERPTGAIFNDTTVVPMQCLNHNNLLDIDNDLNSIRETILQSFHLYNFTFVIINVGTHYNEIADEIHQNKNSRSHFKQHILRLLPMLNSLALQHPPHSSHNYPYATHSLQISWLETPLQHYDTPNGYFNGNLTDCVPLKDTSLRSDWRNYEVYSSLSALNISTISIIPLRDLLIPLYREHHRGNGVDCTHYCYWPMLYQSVYKRMLDILLHSSDSRPPLKSHFPRPEPLLPRPAGPARTGADRSFYS